ncbi:MAG: class I SAM-dependent methyltransferase [candidate division Zixibacteria bacterium]|nr:class I SAM-dependent methyltransferase [candidate division Zixibacteria bacterium]
MLNMLYDWPKYYEVAFSFRDIPHEARFIRDCIRRFSAIPVRRVLEIGCGPAPHAGELQSLGYQYTGLDINRKMLAHAENKWRHLNPRPVLLESDMTSFEGVDRADFAYILLGSLYLHSIDEMNSHFDSVAKALNPGGLYFLDGCIQFSDPLGNNRDNAYTIEKDGITVSSEFAIELLDADRQMYEEVWTVNVDDHGHKKKFEMVERNKSIEPTEFVGFISQRPDFELVGWWQDWNFDRPILRASNVTRPIALVRRVASNDR